MSKHHQKSNQSERKKVRFNPEESDVIYFERYPNEDHVVSKPKVTNSTRSVSSSTCRTEEIMVLSTLHGRSRRELREIDKRDLQAAVKNGRCTPAQLCRRTGEQRWKFEYGNVVYITDSTGTIEITSYKQPVEIQRATITEQMFDRHIEVARILRDEPQLCTTHSIIVIDQSGSMKKADVNGFRNRSQAAYGALALDYVAEQLYDRGDDCIVDAVTIIEMNDEGSFFCVREPLDWILFNKLLDRQKQARPHSHGNYNNSLELVFQIIKDDREKWQDLDEEDSPAYMLVFLSDGKPSDTEFSDELARDIYIRTLAEDLKTNFTFCAMGLGAKGSEFGALRSMALIAEQNGSNGTFNHAGLSAANLSSAFSSISATMTSTRIDKLAVEEDAPDKDEKVVPLKDRNEFANEGKFRSYTNSVSRWRYNHSKWERYGYPWDRIDMRNSKAAIGFKVDTVPFGKGAERLAYRLFEVDKFGTHLGKVLVAKESKKVVHEDKKMNFHEKFCRVQNKASELARQFNKYVKKCPALKPVEEYDRVPELIFLQCHVYEYLSENKTLSGVLVENFLKGTFTKYNSNNGLVNKNHNGKTILLQVGEIVLDEILQSFSHWPYVHSDQKMIVCDLQGILNEEGRYPKFELTDPAICSKNRKDYRYGKTDMGFSGIRNFCRTYQCSKFCEGLGLPRLGFKK